MIGSRESNNEFHRPTERWGRIMSTPVAESALMPLATFVSNRNYATNPTGAAKVPHFDEQIAQRCYT